MRVERRPAGAGLGIVFGAVMGLGLALAAVWLRLGLPLPACPFRAWTGLPCPTCGSSRMISALLRGDPAAAFAWNPLAFLALAAVAAWFAGTLFARLASWPAWRVVPGPAERAALRLAAVLALALDWAYLVWRGV